MERGVYNVECKRFCSFPQRHGEARDYRRSRLEPQNKHFVRDFLQFWHFDSLDNERFGSFPHRHGEARDSGPDMLEPQNEHFVRDFLEF